MDGKFVSGGALFACCTGYYTTARAVGKGQLTIFLSTDRKAIGKLTVPTLILYEIHQDMAQIIRTAR